MATTSWGGSVIGTDQDKDCKYWMFAAEMAQQTSQVVTAISDTQLGPFVRQALAIPAVEPQPGG